MKQIDCPKCGTGNFRCLYLTVICFCLGAFAGTQFNEFTHVPRFYKDKTCEGYCQQLEKNSPYPQPRPENPWERKDAPPNRNKENEQNTKKENTR